MKSKLNLPAGVKLPAGILESDLMRPAWDSEEKLAKEADGWTSMQFDIWYTAKLGWVIPTLLIARAGAHSRPGAMDRTYATTLQGSPCRVGLGPHVLAHFTVHVREARLAALKPYVDLRNAGQVTSNEIRDRISSRRAQGQAMRAQGRTSWRWDS